MQFPFYGFFHWDKVAKTNAAMNTSFCRKKGNRDLKILNFYFILFIYLTRRLYWKNDWIYVAIANLQLPPSCRHVAIFQNKCTNNMFDEFDKASKLPIKLKKNVNSTMSMLSSTQFLKVISSKRISKHEISAESL